MAAALVRREPQSKRGRVPASLLAAATRPAPCVVQEVIADAARALSPSCLSPRPTGSPFIKRPQRSRISAFRSNPPSFPTLLIYESHIVLCINSQPRLFDDLVLTQNWFLYLADYE